MIKVRTHEGTSDTERLILYDRVDIILVLVYHIVFYFFFFFF